MERETEPELVALEAPLVMETEPPIAEADVAPEEMETDPPAPVFPEPTARVISPPAPPMAVPV